MVQCEANFKNLDKTYIRIRGRWPSRKTSRLNGLSRRLLMKFVYELNKDPLLIRYSVEEDGKGNANVIYELADRNDR